MKVIDNIKFIVRIWNEENRPMLNPIEFSTFEDAKTFMVRTVLTGSINGKTNTPVLGAISMEVSFHGEPGIMTGSNTSTICTLTSDGEWGDEHPFWRMI